MMRNVDEDEKLTYTNPNNVCGGQGSWFLTEDGLYEVLMQSRKPIAKPLFKAKDVDYQLINQKVYATNPQGCGFNPTTCYNRWSSKTHHQQRLALKTKMLNIC